MQANDSILVTPGAGATVATHLAGGKEHQVVILANQNGHLVGMRPIYRMYVGKQAAGASRVYFDLFNAAGSGKYLQLLSCVPLVSGAVAVTGTLSVDLHLTRTSDVGTGGTAATGDGINGGSAQATIDGIAIGRTNPSDAQLPVGITARRTPTGGATAGQIVSWCSVFTEETNASSYLGHFNDLASRMRGSEFGGIMIPEGTGIRVVQGTVASVGNIGFDLIFAAE
jgi:hypothetical protein